MASEPLNEVDYTILLEALAVWAKHCKGPGLPEVLELMMTTDSKEDFNRRMDRLRAEHEAGQHTREEQAILLQAKLLHLRDEDRESMPEVVEESEESQ